MSARGAWLAILSLGVLAAAPAAATGERRTLDDFAQPSRWLAVPAQGVDLTLAGDRGPATTPTAAHALRLDFDFHGRGGWAAARRPLPLELPENWELRLKLRAEAPVNHLEVKLVDPSGENVWWSVRRDYAFPRDWSELRIKKRQVSFAWGPAGGGEARLLGAIELAVTAGNGGRGTVWIADLELVPLPPSHPYAGTPTATASAALDGYPAAAAVDADPATAWRAAPGEATLAVDFGEPRELGGLTLRWNAGRSPRRFALDLSDDGAQWSEVRRVDHGGADRTDLLLPETETRFLRLRILESDAGTGLATIQVRPLDVGSTRNAFVSAIAAESPRGTYPRAFGGEQVYWTVVGVDGDVEESLMLEDGAIELGDGRPSLEPFLWSAGKLLTWADVRASQRLADGDLPIPTVEWVADDLRLEVTALATGEAGSSALVVRYRLTNLAAARREARLLLALRPFQANPPQQFLGRAGGVVPIASLACDAAGVTIDGRPSFTTVPPPVRCGVGAFDEGPLVVRLAGGEVPALRAATDETGLPSAALLWPFVLAPRESRDVLVEVPYHPSSTPVADSFDERFVRERARWREKLDRVRLDLPAEAGPLAATMRSSLGFVLVHRDGPAIQPGSRAYARSWIRDGALTGDALLRLGHAAEVREFAEWFAGFQYPDGRVPCCVDRRGADPVPENDSHGQLVHLIAEVYRYTGDRAFAERMLPAVERAVAAIDRLRGERRTEAYRSPEKLPFFGLLPESISHEGYSAKPMHSYWDDAFAYRGLADAAALAAALGRPELAARFAASRDEMRADLVASLARTMERHGLATLPGCVELGDFDATSSTSLLEPGGLGEALPRAAVEATFARYADEFAARRDGRRAWEVYTPYELRSVGAFARLGWRERAGELLDWFLRDRRPTGWNAWAEVVAREPRAARFVGDLPHGWVATDFVRSLLDLFAFERRDEDVLVLGAGIPARWLERRDGVAIHRLRTPWGSLGYRLTRQGGSVRYELDADSALPPGGLRLTWPLAGRAGSATVDGRAAPLGPDGELSLRRLPAVVDLMP